MTTQSELSLRSAALGVIVFGLFVALGACGGSSPVTESLSPEGLVGLEAARAAGCAACHGSNGEGVEGLGPSFIGIFGSEVTLDDGSVVVADRDYLLRSIVEPDAEIVMDFPLPMPPYNLDQSDVDSILTYLEEAK